MRAKNAPVQGRRFAFTLIELLVVIAIIAILAAILFPVFAQARAKARAITCLSNEKGIGLASMQYLQDYDETILPEWLNYPDSFLGNQTAPNKYNYTGVRGWRKQWPYIIQPYMKNFGALNCAEVPDDAGNGWAADPEQGGLKGSSININDTMVTWGTSNPDGSGSAVASYAQYQRPAQDVHFADAGSVYKGGNMWSGSKAGREQFLKDPDSIGQYTAATRGGHFTGPLRSSWGQGSDFTPAVPRHNGFCNVIFFDGHAKAIKLSQYWIRPGITTIAKRPGGEKDRLEDMGTENDIFQEAGVRGGDDNRGAAWVGK